MSNRRTTRQDELSQVMIEQLLRALCEARRTANLLKAHVRPFGADYNHLRELTVFIDKYQARYTGNPEHFFAGMPTTAKKIKNSK